ncbi:MAG TPA: MFS transporter [Nocardioidaceae bacterium]
MTLTSGAARRRFLVLTALRWGPVGLFIPVLVLLPLERGLTLSQVGLTVAVQGLVVLMLELPTGGLADAWGRRPVLVLAGLVGLASTALFLSASTVAGFAAAYLLQGVYRALDSGPLEAWYVDAVHAASDGDGGRRGQEHEVERGLSRAGAALGVAIAAGALAGGGLVALGDVGPFEALALPVVASLVLQVVGLVAVLVLMTEVRHAAGARAALGAVRQAPHTVAAGLRLLRTSPVLLAIVAVELSWGFGSATYETLLPIRLTEILDDPERAAVIVGPAGSAAWLASALGAALAPWLIRRLGTAGAAATLRVVHGGFVVLMGLFAGVVGVIVAYLVAYASHGAANPPHMSLLHRQVGGGLRATAISVNSMMAQAAGAVGVLVLTAVADQESARVAMYLGGAVLAVAAPLYLPAWRQERARRTDEQRGVAERAGVGQ